MSRLYTMAGVTMADGRAVDPPDGLDPADFASEPADGNCEPGEPGPADPVPVVVSSPDHPELAFVQAKSYAKGRPDGPPLWIVVHDMEASETSTRAENTAQYFATLPDGRSVSSHYCADSNSVVQCVRLADTAYTVGNRPGNYRGINWEFSGFASQTREQWLDAFGVAMFDQAAPIIRSDAQRYGIPLVRRTVAELRSYIPGVTSHNDLREAFGNTTHTDPGPNFPWDYFMELLTETQTKESEVAHLWKDTAGQFWYVTGPLQTKRIVSADEVKTIKYYSTYGPGFDLVDVSSAATDPNVIPGVDITYLGQTDGSGPVNLTPAAVEAVADAVADEQARRLGAPALMAADPTAPIQRTVDSVSPGQVADPPR